MPDFSKRSYEPELMDDLNSGGETIIRTLNEIDFINQWLGGNEVTVSGISDLLEKKLLQKPIKVLDVGCGDGKMLVLIADWFRNKGIEAELVGIDANQHITEYAKKIVGDYPEIQIETGNIFDEEWLNYPCDILTCTLFTHHFTDKELNLLLRHWTTMTKIGLVINDLHRHWFAYFSIKYLTSLFSKSAMVKYDAPLSVLRSFRKQEWSAILKQLNNGYKISWEWAFRWKVIIYH